MMHSRILTFIAAGICATALAAQSSSQPATPAPLLPSAPPVIRPSAEQIAKLMQELQLANVCAIPLVSAPIPKNLEPMPVKHPAPERLERMPVLKPVPACGQESKR